MKDTDQALTSQNTLGLTGELWSVFCEYFENK